jgi:hypothetical protein
LSAIAAVTSAIAIHCIRRSRGDGPMPGMSFPPQACAASHVIAAYPAIAARGLQENN